MISQLHETHFKIDKLTNSIENAFTEEHFDTEVGLLNSSKEIRKTEWKFDWKKEIKDVDCTVYKLTTLHNPTIIHGLVSITDKGDHIFMNLIESAKFNKGKGKIYKGVMGNLVAFCCRLSFEKGYTGIVAFVSKTQLIDHYKQSLGAKTFSGNRMFIDSRESRILVTHYFKEFE